MGADDRFTDDEMGALALGPAAAAAAVVGSSHTGVFGIVKEVRAGMKAVKENAPDGPAGDLVQELIAYAKDNEASGKKLDTESGEKDEIRAAALEAIDEAGAAAAKLTPEELDGYVSWLAGIGRSVAQAASDKGSDVAVSSAEEETLTEIERRLRRR